MPSFWLARNATEVFKSMICGGLVGLIQTATERISERDKRGIALPLDRLKHGQALDAVANYYCNE